MLPSPTPWSSAVATADLSVALATGAAAEDRISFLGAASRTHPRTEKGWLRHRVKFVTRAVGQSSASREWLKQLMRPALQPLWTAHPRLASKLQRPYVHRDWSLLDRLDAVQSHYRAVESLFSPRVAAQIYGGGLTLVRLREAAGGRSVALRLTYVDQFEKEGEMTLTVVDEATGLELATMTFCLLETGKTRALWIGGLQANPSPQTRLLINEVAKQMHGLRPKALALWAVRQLAEAWTVDRLMGVSDAQHIYRHNHKVRSFAASYDEFWAESGGLRQADGWQLPLYTPQRRREELKASRRKAHERRYAMLADLAIAFGHSVSTFTNPGSDGARATEFVYAAGRPSPAATKGRPAAALADPDARAAA